MSANVIIALRVASTLADPVKSRGRASRESTSTEASNPDWKRGMRSILGRSKRMKGANRVVESTAIMAEVFPF